MDIFGRHDRVLRFQFIVPLRLRHCRHLRTVSSEEAMEFAEKNNLAFIEVRVQPRLLSGKFFRPVRLGQQEPIL